MRRRPIALALVTATLAACAAAPDAQVDAPGPTRPTGTSSATAESASGEAATTAEPAVAPGPAPTFAALRAAVMACPADEDGVIDASCEAYDRWQQEEAPFEAGAANRALLEMLASSAPKERLLAAGRLRTAIDEEKLAPETVESLLAAAEKERVVPVAEALAELLASLDLVKAGKIERAVAVAKAHPVPEFADAYLLHAGWSNRDKVLLAYAAEASRAKSSRLRNAALATAAKHTAAFAADACKVVNALRADKDRFVSNRARAELAGASTCAAHFDRLLDDLGAVDVSKDVDQSYGIALDSLCQSKAPSDMQRARANKAARRISEAKAVTANTKYYTLSAVMRCDPKEGPAFVARFKSDPSETIAGRATELTK